MEMPLWLVCELDIMEMSLWLACELFVMFNSRRITLMIIHILWVMF